MTNLIRALHAEYFRQFQKIDVQFNKKFNFIAGPNGCGKTTILAAIAHCFSHDLSYTRFTKNTQYWVDIDIYDAKYRLGVGLDAIQYKGYRNQKVNQWIGPPKTLDRVSFSNYFGADEIKSHVPLFIGSTRKIKYQRIDGLKRELEQPQASENYYRNTIQSLYGDWKTDIKQWFINRYFIIEKDWAYEEKLNWQHLVENLPKIAPFDSDFKYIKTARDLEPIFSIYGNECYLEEISSGFQAVLLIISNIIEWIEATRSPGDRIISKACGTVLIDELDLHLHPEWQFTIRDSLEAIFPNIQFIVTTHYPHLLASAKENEVIVLPDPKKSAEYLDLKPESKLFSGWNTDQILEDVMGVRSLQNKDYEKSVAKAMECIENKDSFGLKKEIENLKNICHPNDTLIIIFMTKLASMKALEDDKA